MYKNKLLFWLLFLLAQNVCSQGYYLCYFVDKPISSNSTYPSFLSERCLQRKQAAEIVLDERDYPVDSTYLERITELGVTVRTTSKWLNAALIWVADSGLLAVVDTLSFVSKTEFVTKHSGGINSLENEDLIGEETFLNQFDYERVATQGDGILIAVTDGGFLGVDTLSTFQHLFANHKVEGFNLLHNSETVFNYNEHGTNVLSLMASAAIGLVPNASYQLYVTEDVDSESALEEVLWLRAAEMADSSGVDIINVSLGYNIYHDVESEDYTFFDMNGATTIISRAANIATEKGMVVVASAGNDGNTSWGKIVAPADAFDVIAVGSVNRNLQKSVFSSVGPTADNRLKPEISARGENVSVISSNGNRIENNGTSFSAPIITSMCAIAKQLNPLYSVGEIKQAIIQGGANYPESDNELGFGVFDFEKFIQQVEVETAELVHWFVTSNGDLNVINLTGNETVIALYTLKGQKVTDLVSIKRKEIISLTPYTTCGMFVLRVVVGDKTEIHKVFLH